MKKNAFSRYWTTAAGNKSEAARLLGISRVALYKKLKRFNIHVDKKVRT